MRPAIILVPYFGDWPPWLALYLRSCALNPQMDWLLIGDSPPPECAPPNVRFLRLDLEEFLGRIGEQTGLRHRLLRPYKICDFKPVLGAAFAREISRHAFFGWGDLDLVYGQFERLCLPLLDHHEVVSFSGRPFSNYTCLLRNEPRLLRLYQQVPCWREKLAAPVYQGFDDVDFSPLALATGRVWNHECYTTPLVKDCPWIGDAEPPRRWTWHRGRVTNDANPGFQFVIFHFMVWKPGPRRPYHQNVPQWKNGEAVVEADDIDSGKAFHFTETGIMAETLPAQLPDLPFATDLSVALT
jgi:hypothetical protein